MNHHKQVPYFIILGIYSPSTNLDTDQLRNLIDNLIADGYITEEDIYDVIVGPNKKIASNSHGYFYNMQWKVEVFIDKIKHLIPCEDVISNSSIYSLAYLKSKDLQTYFIERAIVECPEQITNIHMDIFLKLESEDLVIRCMDIIDNPAQKIIREIYNFENKPKLIHMLCDRYVLSNLDTIDNIYQLLQFCRGVGDKTMQEMLVARLRELKPTKDDIYHLIRDYGYDASFSEVLIDIYEDVHGEIVLGTDAYPFHEYDYVLGQDFEYAYDATYRARICDRIQTTDDAQLLMTNGFRNNLAEVVTREEYNVIDNLTMRMYDHATEPDIAYLNGILEKVVAHIRSKLN